MANLACNGCLLTIDGRSYNYAAQNTSGAVEQYHTGYAMTGVGIGLLTGVTGVPLCYVDVIISYPSNNGYCTSFTGDIQVLRPGGHPNSPTGYTSRTGVTGCTGMSGCNASLDFYVDPNYLLYSQISGSTLHMTITNFYDGSVSQTYINENTTIPSGGLWTGYPIHSADVTMGCGEKAHYRVEARWLTPLGLSGQLLAVRNHTTDCSYCSQYEMVALP
jgi:hypothetical protein